jgi:prophage regulatory protein
MPEVTAPVILLRVREVKRITGLSTSRLYALIKENKFPRQIRLGTMSVAWSSIEISDWVATRIAESRKTEGAV